MQTLSENEHLSLVFLNEPELDLHFEQLAHSSLQIHLIDLPEDDHASYHNHIIVEQNGEGCSTEIYHLSSLHAMQQVTTHTDVRHNIGGGVSRQTLKFVLADQAHGDFYGQLYIAPDAQQTEAQQVNRNLLLSPKALMRTRPQLEIYADDVKASHGATTGQLDERSIFYMQQRCIDYATARDLLIRAFMEDIVASIPDPEKLAQVEALLQ